MTPTSTPRPRWCTATRFDRIAAMACCAATWGAASCVPVWADDGFASLGLGLQRTHQAHVELHGDFRTRSEALYDLDLDRGTTPSGQLTFPVPLGNPAGQWLTAADVRVRTNVSAYAPGGQVAVHMRLDLLDDLALGSTPSGPVAASISQAPPAAAIRLKRAWGEALLPFGVLAAGRMGSHWGLGMLTHGGDCEDCDRGDAADRIALVTPVLNHLIAVAYDFSAVGPQGTRVDAVRAIDLDPGDDVRSVTAAVLQWRSPDALKRRLAAGRSTLDYGLFASHRWQGHDTPIGVDSPTSAQVLPRRLRATAADLWVRWLAPRWRIELESAVLTATIQQPSLLPGVLYRQGIESQEFGAVVQVGYGAVDEGWLAGADAGVASGDAAPGFSRPDAVLQASGRAGDLFAGQLDPPRDRRADDFHFHPDFRVDRILFREILGTVTDAAYLRPHIRWRDPHFGAGRLDAELAVVASTALYATSTPSGRRPLGVEIDPTLAYHSDDGFGLVLAGGLLLPGTAFDNPTQQLTARPAGLLQVRLHYRF